MDKFVHVAVILVMAFLLGVFIVLGQRSPTFGDFGGISPDSSLIEGTDNVRTDTASCYFYLPTDRDNVVCRSGMPGIGSFMETSGVIQNTNCVCQNRDNTEHKFTACTTTATHWGVYYPPGDPPPPPRIRAVSRGSNLIGDGSLCKTKCPSDRTLAMPPGPVCGPGVNREYTTNDCLAGEVYLDYLDSSGATHKCFNVEDNGLPQGDPLYADWCTIQTVEENYDEGWRYTSSYKDPPCCLNQDGDSEAIQEYREDACGKDCDDDNKDVQYGCSRRVRVDQLG